MHTLSQKIVGQLPDLRSYAHALSGSRKRGDDRLRLFLEVLLEHRQTLSQSGELRTDLFRFFHDVLHRLNPDLAGDIAEDGLPEQRLRHALAALPLRAREVLLLTAVAGFNTAKVSHILRIARRGIERQLRDARRQIKQRMSARILIVEDEARIAAEIEHAVTALGYTVVGVARSERGAGTLAHDVQPELVLADLPGAEGVRAQNLRDAVAAPVVFLQAPHRRRSTRALSAKRPAPRRDARRRMSTRAIRSAVREALSATAIVAVNASR